MMRQSYNKKHESLDTSFNKSSTQLGLSVADVFSCISDEKALSIFKAIGQSADNNNSLRSDIIITKLGLSHKQYYSRMQKLVQLGLIKRNSRKYYLTSFGKIVFNTYLKIVEPAVKYHCELKAIDSIMTMHINTLIQR